MVTGFGYGDTDNDGGSSEMCSRWCPVFLVVAELLVHVWCVIALIMTEYYFFYVTFCKYIME